MDRITGILQNTAAQRAAMNPPPLPDPIAQWQAAAPTAYSNPNVDAATQIIQQAQAGNPMAQAAVKSADNFVKPGDVEGLNSYLNYIHDLPESIDPSNSYQVMTAGARWAKQNSRMPSPIEIATQDKANILAGKASNMMGIEQEAAKNISLADKYENFGTGGSGGVTGFVYNKLRSALEAGGVQITPEMDLQLVNVSRNGLQKGATITVNGQQIAVENILGTTGMLEAQAAASQQGEKNVDLAMNGPIAKATEEGKAQGSPIPEGAMKDIQDKEQLVSQLGGVNADLQGIVDAIGGNDLNLGPAENAKSMAKNWASMSDPNSRNFQTLKATLEAQRNASLLLAKGVQTEGDAKRAWDQLMSNLNDAQNVSRRLKEIMAINQRSAKLQHGLSNENRANYQRPPKNFDEAFSQPKSVQMESNTSNPIDDELRKRGVKF